MTTPRKFALFTTVLALCSLLCMAVLHLANHDIFHDYVSQNVLAAQGISLSLPPSAACAPEWRVAVVAFWTMAVLNVALVFASLWQYRAARRDATVCRAGQHIWI